MLHVDLRSFPVGSQLRRPPRGARESQCFRLAVGDVDYEAKQRRRKDLALRVGLERQRSAAVEGAVQQEIERFEIRKLESLDRTRDDAPKVLFDALECEIFHEHWIPLRPERDDTDVRGIALVA